MDENNGDLSWRLTQIRVTFCDNKTRIFAKKTGINENMLANFCSGLRKPGRKTLEKILAAFPAVNADWLLMGEGEMLSAGGDAAKGQRSNGEPAVPLSLYADAIRENERLRMEVERLREKVKSLSARMGEECILP